jgi:hypothetical protein
VDVDGVARVGVVGVVVARVDREPSGRMPCIVKMWWINWSNSTPLWCDACSKQDKKPMKSIVRVPFCFTFVNIKSQLVWDNCLEIIVVSLQNLMKERDSILMS